MTENLTADDIRTAVDIIVAEDHPLEERIFFAYWPWWEVLGKPNDYFGVKMLVFCSQDNQWHTPQEIKNKGWERSEDATD